MSACSMAKLFREWTWLSVRTTKVFQRIIFGCPWRFLVVLDNRTTTITNPVRQTPRYGVDETFISVSLLRVYSNSRFFYFGLDTLRTEHFEGLKHIPHRSAQSCNADRSLCSCSWSARHFIGRYRRQSSAKRRTCEETVEGRSLI